MAQNDDKSRRAKGQEGRRVSGEAAQQAAATSESAKTASEEIANASRDYCRAIYQAWLRAAEDSGKAQFELAATQHRVMHEAGAQRSAAYFNWMRAVQDSSVNTGGSALKEAYEACSKAFDEAAKAGRNEWNESLQSRQRVLTASTETYANEVQKAVNTYLSRIRAVWGNIDVAAADPQTLTSLAAASVHALRAAQATSRNRA